MRRAAEAEAGHWEERSILMAGGVLAGDKLVFKQPVGGAEVMGRRVSNSALGGEHSFQPASFCVVQQNWLPLSGKPLVVAGAADGAGWLVAADGGRVSGVWAFEAALLITVFEVGVQGVVCGLDSEGARVAVEAFQWPSVVEVDQGNAWCAEEGIIGTINPYRKVRLVAVEQYARGGDMLLVEDAEDISYDLEAD